MLEKVKKVREGLRKLEKVGDSWRRLEKVNKVRTGWRKLEKVG